MLVQSDFGGGKVKFYFRCTLGTTLEWVASLVTDWFTATLPKVKYLKRSGSVLPLTIPPQGGYVVGVNNSQLVKAVEFKK